MEVYKIKYLNEIPFNTAEKEEMICFGGLIGFQLGGFIGVILFDDSNLATSVRNPWYSVLWIYISVGLFISVLFMFAIWFSLNGFHKFKMPKLYLRTPKGSLESKNGSQYTPLIADV